MESGQSPSTKSFWRSVLTGAYVGIALQMLLMSWNEPLDVSELWAIPVLLIVYGSIAIPFVAAGLAIFGLPFTRLLVRKAHSWWVGVVAVLWGATAGKLLFYIIDHLLFTGSYEIEKFQLFDMGIIYGIPTGIAWWLFCLREIINRQHQTLQD